MKYTLSGRVIHGDGYGIKLGFPTANLDRIEFLKLKKRPRLGVYAGKFILNGKKYRAGIVIGPIDKRGLPKIESHLIGFKGNIYGKKATVQIEKFLRVFKKFKTKEELLAQIRKDLKMC